MSIQLYPSIAKIKRNGVYENLPGFVPETGSIATQQMIATSESSATAQYVHNKGEYFRLNDTLYQAIVKINVGDAIVVGTNCEVAVIGNDLTHVANSIAAYELGIATSSHNTGDYFMVNETMYVATADIQVGDNISTSTNCRKAVVGDELSGLKTALTKFVDDTFDIEEHKSLNLLDSDEIESGYYWTDGWHSSSSYNSTPFIPVTAGQKLWCQYGLTSAASRQKANLRFVTGYNSEKQIISSAAASNVYSYVVPDGVSFVILSIMSSHLVASQLPVVLAQEEDVIQDYIPYYEPYQTTTLKAECNNEPYINSLINDALTNRNNNLIFKATSSSLAANTNLICCERSNNKKNEYIELTAFFDTFDELTISHGKGSFMGGYIIITSNKISIYNGYDNSLIEEFEHGLTLSDFINVIIYTKNDSVCRSSITIMTAGGNYTAQTTRFYGIRGAVLCNATFAMTDVTMQYTVNDAREDVWVFGDSYISLGDPNRWATQLVLDGHKKLLLDGWGGATAQDVYPVVEYFTNITTPKYIVWCLGMNNGDNNAINSQWKTSVDNLLSLCESKGIIPILSTIPNVPNIDHTYKNAYVKSLNVRYVDFAKAVNAESAGATWYTGMLSSDNTHPTALGAKALMRQFLLDVPEVLYAEE